MTHIAAFIVPENDKPDAKNYAIAIADTRSFSEEFGPNPKEFQKLFKANNNLIMGTGYLSTIKSSIKQLGTGKMTPGEVSQKLFDLTKDLDAIFGANFIVVGEVDTEPEIWHVKTVKGSHKDLGFHNAEAMAIDGSGRYHSVPIITMYEKRNILSNSSLTEGIIFGYELGRIGAQTITCSDKVQFGLIGNGRVKTLYHPEIEYDTDMWIMDNFGIEFKENTSEDTKKEEFAKTFYDAIRRRCSQIYGIDERMNRILSSAKNNPAQRQDLDLISKLLKVRDDYKLELTDAIGKWLKGDIKDAMEYAAKRPY